MISSSSWDLSRKSLALLQWIIASCNLCILFTNNILEHLLGWNNKLDLVLVLKIYRTLSSMHSIIIQILLKLLTQFAIICCVWYRYWLLYLTSNFLTFLNLRWYWLWCVDWVSWRCLIFLKNYLANFTNVLSLFLNSWSKTTGFDNRNIGWRKPNFLKLIIQCIYRALMSWFGCLSCSIN